MPQFFFDYHAPGHVSKDEIGCEFDSLELAYLDAFRSMVDIGAELLKEQKNPGSHRIEIVDQNGVVLDTLLFDDIFRRRPATSASSNPLRAEIQLNRRLRAEMWEACHTARDLVAATRETLRQTSSSAVLALKQQDS